MLRGTTNGEKALRDFVARRRAYVATVDAAEASVRWSALEQGITKAVRTAGAAKHMAGHREPKEIVVERPEILPPAGAIVEVAGKIVTEQSVDVYRRAKTQAAEWSDYKEYERALQIAEDQYPDLVRKAPRPALVFERARVKGYLEEESFRITVQEEKGGVRIVRIDWGQELLADDSLVAAQQAGEDAVFDASSEGSTRTTSDYRAEIRSLIQAVESRVNAQVSEAQEFANRYAGVWRGRLRNTSNDIGRIGDSAGSYRLTIGPDLREAEYVFEDFDLKLSLAVRREGQALVMEAKKPVEVTIRLEADGNGSRGSVKSQVTRGGGKWAEAEGSFARTERWAGVSRQSAASKGSGSFEQSGIPQTEHDLRQLLTAPLHGQIGNFSTWRTADGLFHGRYPASWNATAFEPGRFFSITFMTPQTRSAGVDGDEIVVYRSLAPDPRGTWNLGIKIPVGSKKWTNDQAYRNELAGLKANGEVTLLAGPTALRLADREALCFLALVREAGALKLRLKTILVIGEQVYSVHGCARPEHFRSFLDAYKFVVATIHVSGP